MRYPVDISRDILNPALDISWISYRHICASWAIPYQLNGYDIQFHKAAETLIDEVKEARNIFAHFDSKLYDPEHVMTMKNSLVQLLHCFGLEILHAQGDSIPV